MNERDQLHAVDILGIRVHGVTSGQVLSMMAQWIDHGQPHQIATVNPEFIMLARQDPAFRQVLNDSDLSVPDGVGLLWAARLLGEKLPERVTGSDLVPKVAQHAAGMGWRLFLLGAGEGVAAQTAQLLSTRYDGFRVVGVYAGSPRDEEAAGIIRTIRSASPDVLFVAYGAPAQDLWIAQHRDELGVPVMMGVGGAFDHIAGIQRRAPRWVQSIHLEWLFRLLTQPWRWRRQLALPRFMAAVLSQVVWRSSGP